MAESKLRNLSVEFSAKIIKLCENIKGHYSLTNQLERSATSIGANIHEANYAQSKNVYLFCLIEKLEFVIHGSNQTHKLLRFLIIPQ